MMESSQLAYFAPLLPWQQALWQRLTNTALQNGHLPHAMLASGMAGIGKRAFVWRWVAWQLCHNRVDNPQSACGHCESCQWLTAGTHPNLAVLPQAYLPKSADHQQMVEQTASSKKSDKKANKLQIQKQQNSKPKIKIDDVRAIQDFVHQGSSGMRICVFDHADTMTIAAANALLKTLEEPKQGVQLILITDKPSLLLPTIKSRVQQLPLTDIANAQVIEYVKTAVAHLQLSDEQIAQLLHLSANAPLQAVAMAQADWYGMRELWLKTWLSLRSGSRSAVVASDYWQTQLSLEDFIKLSQVMLTDIQRLSLDLPTYQQDMDFSAVTNTPEVLACSQFNQHLQWVSQSLKQNIQDKLAYDEIIQALALL